MERQRSTRSFEFDHSNPQLPSLSIKTTIYIIQCGIVTLEEGLCVNNEVQTRFINEARMVMEIKNGGALSMSQGLLTHRDPLVCLSYSIRFYEICPILMSDLTLLMLFL